MKKIRLGTRGSKLALRQAEIVSSQIKSKIDIEIQIVPITTKGDKIQDKPLYNLGGKALFIKELEENLLKNQIDIAIHSLKDIPGEIPDVFEIASVLERANPEDVLISSIAKSIDDLPKGARVGTSSPRRIIYLKKMRPDLDIRPIRGNIDTRIEKIKNKGFDATILARAGLDRLYGKLDEDICHPITIEELLPAVGQGAIALEVRIGDHASKEIAELAKHQESFDLVSIERAYLSRLEADCKTPLAAYARMLDQSKVQIDFMLGDDDWKKSLFHQEICDLKEGQKLAIITADRLKEKL